MLCLNIWTAMRPTRARGRAIAGSEAYFLCPPGSPVWSPIASARRSATGVHLGRLLQRVQPSDRLPRPLPIYHLNANLRGVRVPQRRRGHELL